MKRLYYFAKSLTSVQGITTDLRQAGIGENRLHVMGNDSSAMAQAHVHTATPWEETDIMHSGFVGALGGMAAGLVVGFMLAGADPWYLFRGLAGWPARGVVPQPSPDALSGPGGAG